jgi:hypothetical protein
LGSGAVGVNVYFELADCVAKDIGGKYFALYNATEGEVMMAHERYLMMYSERVWAEEDNGYVRFMKNRYEYADNAPVDLKEFFWIRLRCRTV